MPASFSLFNGECRRCSPLDWLGALWKWDYWGAALPPSARTNLGFFASNNKTQLFSQCTPHPRPGVIVLCFLTKVKIQTEKSEETYFLSFSLSRLNIQCQLQIPAIILNSYKFLAREVFFINSIYYQGKHFPLNIFTNNIHDIPIVN